MPTSLRILLFVLEWCIFIFFAIFSTYKKYKKEAKLIGGIIYFGVCTIAILLFFVLGYPSYIFLSYNKMILQGLIILCFILLRILWNMEENSKYKISLKPLIPGIFWLLVGAFITAYVNISTATDFWVTMIEEKCTSVIVPTINGKNGVGEISNDQEVIAYTFSYVENGESYYAYVDSSKITLNSTENTESPYAIKESTITTRHSDEKRENKQTIENDVTYEIYISSSQIVKLKEG